MKIKSFFLIAVLFFFGTHNLHSIEPDIFVQSTVNRASSILSSEITKEEKVLELKQIARETVDINGIGFYTLGSF